MSKFSDNMPLLMKQRALYAEAASQEYLEKVKKEEDEAYKFLHGDIDKLKKETEMQERASLINRRSNLANRRISFNESVTNSLLAECIYTVYHDAMRKNLVEQSGIPTMMRAMISQFLKEDCNSILSKMRTKTAVLSEMYNLITNTRKAIMEDVDECLKAGGDIDSFKIKNEIKDDFFSKLEDLDTESISNAIRERVAAATEKFEMDNIRDHNQIVAALQATKDKLEEVKDKPEEVKESYQLQSKRYISQKIRNREKGVFESMVTAVCESALKNPELKQEFTEGAKINVGKVIDRVETMYTFIETVSTMNLYPVDEQYMQDLIESLRK